MDEELKGTEYLSLDVGGSKSGGRVNNGRTHRQVLVGGARRRISSSSLSRVCSSSDLAKQEVKRQNQRLNGRLSVFVMTVQLVRLWFCLRQGYGMFVMTVQLVRLWFCLRQGYGISSQNSVVPEVSNQSLDEVINVKLEDRCLISDNARNFSLQIQFQKSSFAGY